MASTNLDFVVDTTSQYSTYRLCLHEPVNWGKQERRRQEKKKLGKAECC